MNAVRLSLQVFVSIVSCNDNPNRLSSSRCPESPFTYLNAINGIVY